MPVYTYRGDVPRSLPEYGLERIEPGDTVEVEQALDHPDFEDQQDQQDQAASRRRRRSRAGLAELEPEPPPEAVVEPAPEESPNQQSPQAEE